VNRVYALNGRLCLSREAMDDSSRMRDDVQERPQRLLCQSSPHGESDLPSFMGRRSKNPPTRISPLVGSPSQKKALDLASVDEAI